MNTQAARFWLFCSTGMYAVLIGCLAVVIATVFFVAPGLYVHAVGKPLFMVIEHSLGYVPAFWMRLCAVGFLVSWLAAYVALPLRVWSNNLAMRISAMQHWGVATAVLIFLYLTGGQSLHVLGRLASFTNRLGIAILVAALVRVRDGWPAVFGEVSKIDGVSWKAEVWSGASEVAFYVAPIGLLCCTFVSRLGERKQVVAAGMAGVAVPLFISIFLAAVIGTATHASTFYQPSLQPTVAMALWAHAARSAVSGRMLVAAVTTFGAVRLGSRFIVDTVAATTPRPGPTRVLGTLFFLGTAWLSLDPFAVVLTTTLDWSARFLGGASAVITADLVTRTTRSPRKRAMVWTSSCALVAGLIVPLYISPGPIEWTVNPWWHPRVLPSFLITFGICSGFNLVQRTRLMRRP